MASKVQRPKDRDGFEVAIFCALPLVFELVEALFDEHWDEDGGQYDEVAGDICLYRMGVIGHHNVVLAHMPNMGKAGQPASFASRFGRIKLALVVGICSGMPTGIDNKEIILGDVIISTEIIPYDFGRNRYDRFIGKDTPDGSLESPNTEIRAFLSELEAPKGRTRLRDSALGFLEKLCREADFQQYRYPGPDEDELYESSYRHKHHDQSDCTICAESEKKGGRVCQAALESTCSDLKCSNDNLVQRERLRRDTDAGKAAEQRNPSIHFGVIASGNSVMKSGEHLDTITSRDKVVAFEMEAAGIWDHFPCVVIKGVCDYADGHRNKKWHSYAAATAAACMKAFLKEWVPGEELSSDTRVLGPKGHWLVPFSRNEKFIGREAQLEEIIGKLAPYDNKKICHRVAITGLGGIGKTQIALEAAFRIREKYDDYSVFWISAVDSTSFEAGYHSVGQELGVAGIDDPGEDVKLLVKAHLSQESTKRWLLIIDNADSLEWLHEKGDETDESNGGFSSPALGAYLPSSRQGSILFTTRNCKLAVKLAGIDVVTVQEMSEIDSIRLFETSLIRKILITERDTAKELLELLTSLPLAVKQAAAFINQNQISISDYLEMCESSDQGLIELLSEDFADHGRYQTIRNPVALTWLSSFEQIEKYDTIAADYLCFMSFIAHQDIPYSLLPAASRLRKTEALGTLKAYGFINFRENGDSCDIHLLVQMAVRNWLTENGKFAKWRLETLKRISKVFPAFQTENLGKCTMYIPHAEYTLKFEDFQGGSNKPLIDLLSNLGDYYSQAGKYDKAEAAYRNAIELMKATLGISHPSTLDSMHNLAIVFQQQGKHTEAEALLRQTVELMKITRGIQHPSTLDSMHNLAIVFHRQCKYTEAEALLRQTVELKKAALGDKHLSRLNSIEMLAIVFQLQGRYDEAEVLLRHILELRKEFLGDDHPDTLAIKHNLLEALQQQGKQAEAGQLQWRPPLKYSQANSISSLADQGQFSDSGYASTKASQIAEKTNKSNAQSTSRVSVLEEEDMETYSVESLENTPSMANDSLIDPGMKDSVFDLILGVIRDDLILKPLFQITLEKIDRMMAVENFEKFLQGYCVLLRAEKPNEDQSRTIQFLRHRARAFAENIYESYEGIEPIDDAEEISKAREARRIGIENVQRALGKHVEPVEFIDPNIASDVTEQPLGNGEVPNTEYPEWPELPENIQEIKLFLTEGQPMKQLRISYEKFLNGEPLTDWNERVKSQIQISANTGQTAARTSALIKEIADAKIETEDENELSATENFIQDPHLYFDSINNLQGHVFELGRQILGKIEQQNGAHVLPLSAISYPTAASSTNLATEQLRLLLERNTGMISAIIEGLRILTEIQFCKSTFNVIVVHPQWEDVLRVIPIEISSLQLLLALSEEALSYCLTPTEWTLIQDTICDLGEAAMLVLQHLGVATPLTGIPSNDQYQRCLYMCQLLSSTCSVLFIGLVSFIKSHIAVSDTSLVQDDIDELRIETVNGPISLKPRRLACLNSFLGHPIWTFSHSSQILPPPGVPTKRYYLSTLLADFIDLWGPLRLVYSDKDEELVAEIRVRGGVIRRSGSVLPTSHPQGVLCHFNSCMDAEISLNDAEPAFSIPTTQYLLIGAHNKPTVPGERQKDHLFQVYHTCRCKSSTSYFAQYRAFELKTKVPSWNLDSRVAQIAGGQYVTAMYGQTWKFSAGWTMKDVIVEDWLERIRDDAVYHPKPFYLDYLVVLEISRCTGHSQRISLWSLLKNPSLIHYLHEILDPSTFKDFDLLTGEILRREFPSDALFVDVWRRLHDDAKEVFKLVMKLVLDNLRSTGIGEDGQLQSWDITSRGRIDGRKTEPTWGSMVKDDVETATFSVITDSCMEYTPWSPSSSNTISQKSTRCGNTILYTSVCITVSRALEGSNPPAGKDRISARSAEHETPQTSSNTNFNQWMVTSSRSREGGNKDNHVESATTAREQFGLNQAAVSSLYARQAARKRAMEEKANLKNTETLADKGPTALDNREAVSNPTENPYKDFQNRSGRLGTTSSPSQPKIDPRSHVMCDASLSFKNGQGQDIGTLILKPQEQMTHINLSTASETEPLPAEWVEHKPSVIDALRAKECAADKSIANWAKRSKGALPWLVNYFYRAEEPRASAAEHIRGGSLTVYQKVLRTCVV